MGACGRLDAIAVQGGAPADAGLADATPDDAMSDGDAQGTEDARAGGCPPCGPGERCVAGMCQLASESPPVAVGLLSTCVRRGGEMYCFGENAGGELGLGDEVSPRRSPERLPGDDWAGVSGEAGPLFCGLAGTSEVRCWGQSDDGALGLGDELRRSTPGALGDGWATVRGGSGHSCGIRLDGSLWCWGRNDDGDLGTGDTMGRTEPALVNVPPLHTISVGWGHSCGLDAAGTLYCWGRNDEGQLGLGDTRDRLAPERIGDRSDWRSVDAGRRFTCGIDAEGQLWCWGVNDRAQLGLGEAGNRATPQLVPTALRFRVVDAGAWGGCALTGEGALYCWGSLQDGSQSLPLPAPLAEARRWEAVDVGYHHSCAVARAGGVWCWGRNAEGQLGRPEPSRSSEPLEVLLP